MKQLYKNCREDVAELCEVLKEGTELTIQESCSGLTKTEKATPSVKYGLAQKKPTSPKTFSKN